MFISEPGETLTSREGMADFALEYRPDRRSLSHDISGELCEWNKTLWLLCLFIHPSIRLSIHPFIFPVLLRYNWHYCSVAKLCLALCHPVDYSTPGFPVLYCLPEFAQIEHCISFSSTAY